MSDIIIQVENISKQYRLGQVSRKALSHDINRWWYKVRGKDDPYLKIGQKNDSAKNGTREYVWALRDINFEVKRGEVLGIIGKNGAGKSTLLKILSKVTAPTTGRIKTRGRIASLLEVGTGFHPELTGRENIFLNGAILGMTKKEIEKKFDEIVDFSGVELYIDTPVKRYSSGMYVRLAFAVAAHLEPDILIVDEVLAVGDAEFQKKCLGRIKDVSEKEGRTVLFVSHQMGSIAQLCNRAILLQNGKIIFDNVAKKTADYYLQTNSNELESFYNTESDEKLISFIREIELIDISGNLKSGFGTNEKIFLRLSVETKKYNPSIEIGLALFDKRKVRVFTIHEKLYNTILNKGKNKAEFIIELPGYFLAPGMYSWVATIHIPHQESYHLLEDVCTFSIIDTGTNLSDYEGKDMGIVLPNYKIIHV